MAIEQLVTAYERKGDDDAAVSGFRWILDLDPSNTQVAKALRKAYERKGDVDTAIIYWTGLVQRFPKNWSAAQELGRAYKRNGDDDAAVSGFRNILDRDANNRWVTEELAEVYKRKGDVEAANALSSALNLSDYSSARGPSLLDFDIPPALLPRPNLMSSHLEKHTSPPNAALSKPETMSANLTHKLDAVTGLQSDTSFIIGINSGKTQATDADGHAPSLLEPIQTFLEGFINEPWTFCETPNQSLPGDGIYHRCLLAVAISTLLNHTLPDLEPATESEHPTLSNEVLSDWTKYLYDSHIRVRVSDELSVIISIPRFLGLGDIQRGKDVLRFIETNRALRNRWDWSPAQVHNA
jgi:hypothetical protein